jgi:hypothetical protein
LNPADAQGDLGAQSDRSSGWKKTYVVLSGLMGLYLLIRLALSRHPVWICVLGPIVLTGMATAFFPMQTRRAFMILFGQIAYTDEVPPEIQERIRGRYRMPIETLNSLGFDMVFFQGQTFPILRLAMVFPAVVIAMMLLNREVITLYGGARLLVGHAVLTSADRETYALILRLGVLFATSFENGEVLISCNYGHDNLKWKNLTRRAYRGQSIADTWAKHQDSIRSIEVQGIRADREPTFEKFVNLVG